MAAQTIGKLPQIRNYASADSARCAFRRSLLYVHLNIFHSHIFHNVFRKTVILSRYPEIFKSKIRQMILILLGGHVKIGITFTNTIPYGDMPTVGYGQIGSALQIEKLRPRLNGDKVRYLSTSSTVIYS